MSSHVQLEKKAASAKAPRSHESARKGVRQVEVGTTHYPWRAFMAFVSAASGNPERQRTRLRRALFAHETKPEPRARGMRRTCRRLSAIRMARTAWRASTDKGKGTRRAGSRSARAFASWAPSSPGPPHSIEDQHVLRQTAHRVLQVRFGPFSTPRTLRPHFCPRALRVARNKNRMPLSVCVRAQSSRWSATSAAASCAWRRSCCGEASTYASPRRLATV